MNREGGEKELSCFLSLHTLWSTAPAGVVWSSQALLASVQAGSMGQWAKLGGVPPPQGTVKSSSTTAVAVGPTDTSLSNICSPSCNLNKMDIFPSSFWILKLSHLLCGGISDYPVCQETKKLWPATVVGEISSII